MCIALAVRMAVCTNVAIAMAEAAAASMAMAVSRLHMSYGSMYGCDSVAVDKAVVCAWLWLCAWLLLCL